MSDEDVEGPNFSDVVGTLEKIKAYVAAAQTPLEFDNVERMYNTHHLDTKILFPKPLGVESFKISVLHC